MLTDRVESVSAPRAPRALRLVVGARDAVPVQPVGPPPQQLDPRPTAQNFARGVAEVLAQARPVDQLRDLATFEVVRLIERATSRQPGQCARQRIRPLLRSVHLQDICPGVIEACTTIDGGTRSRTVAFRLEYGGRGWRATVIELG
jgi:hypothetical protein